MTHLRCGTGVSPVRRHFEQEATEIIEARNCGLSATSVYSCSKSAMNDCAPPPGRMPVSTILLALILSGVVCSILQAHELQPAYLELRETGPGAFDMLWRLPNREELKNLRPVFPKDCV